MSELTKEEEEEIARLVRELMSKMKITMLPTGVIIIDDGEEE
jgi:diadenosine tetraphosphate (Ap4A) HIT family hydrolase